MKFHYSDVLLIFIISAYGIIPYKRRNVTAPQLNLSLCICDLRSTFRKKKKKGFSKMFFHMDD